MKKQLFFFLSLVPLLFTSCSKSSGFSQQEEIYTYDGDYIDSIRTELKRKYKLNTQKLIYDLKGKWNIDSITIDFEDSSYQKEAGINKDTVIYDFGEFTFVNWELELLHKDSTNYEAEIELVFQNNVFPLKFDYLIHNYLLDSSEELNVNSAIHWNLDAENENWKLEDARYLDNLGLIDNVEIIRVNENKYYLVGINRGLQRIDISRK